MPERFTNATTQRLAEILHAAPEVRAVLFGERWSTWGDLAAYSDLLDEELSECGVPRRAAVCVVVHNRPSGLGALIGLLAVGRVPVLISPIQPAVAIASAVEHLGGAAIVAADTDWGPELDAAGTRMGAAGISVRDDVPLGDASIVRRTRRTASDGPSSTWDDSTALVVPTSGTTGPPKAIPLGWSELPIRPDQPLRQPSEPTVRPPVIQALPLATITGVVGVFRAVGVGRAIALLERVDVEEWAGLVERFQLRRAGLPPAAMRTILDQKIPRQRFASLEAWPTGSAPLPPELQREFEETYGVPVLLGYGATEFGGAVSGWTLPMHQQWAATKLGSVGRAVDGVELRIVDEESGDLLPPDVPGILDVRKRGLERAGADGWVRTNDLARLDDDGFLYILGRVDDVVIRGGFKVPLGEVESLFRSHPAVHDVVALGLADRRLGEVPAAAVTLREGAAITGEELRSWSRERIAPYKVPVLVEVVDAFPMLASYKVNKVELRKLLTEELRKGTADAGAS